MSTGASLFDGQRRPGGPVRRRRPAGSPRRRWLRWAVLAVGSAVICGVAAVVALRATGAFTPSHPVPSLIGSSRAAAEQRLQPVASSPGGVRPAYDARAPVGTVISQQPATRPAQGRRHGRGHPSLGPQPVAVPTVAGLILERGQHSARAIWAARRGCRPRGQHDRSGGRGDQQHPDRAPCCPAKRWPWWSRPASRPWPFPPCSGTARRRSPAAQAALAAVDLDGHRGRRSTATTVPTGQVIGTNPRRRDGGDRRVAGDRGRLQGPAPGRVPNVAASPWGRVPGARLTTASR